MSSSDLFRGDPSLLLLGEAEDDALLGGGLLGLEPAVPEPAAPPAPPASPSPPFGAAFDPPTPPGGLVDRVRAGAIKGRRAARHPDDQDVRVFDDGYGAAQLAPPSSAATPRVRVGGAPAPTVAPTRARTPPRAPAAPPTERVTPVPTRSPEGPESIDRSPAGGAKRSRGDRFERATGDVLPAASTVYDFGYTDEVSPLPELQSRAGPQPMVAPDRSAGPLRIFVGRPGVADGSGRRELPDVGDGPVWDASALADGAEQWGETRWDRADDAPLPAEEAPLALGAEADDDSMALEAGSADDLPAVQRPTFGSSSFESPAGGLRVGFRAPEDDDEDDDEDEDELLEALAGDSDPAEPFALSARGRDAFDPSDSGAPLMAEAFPDPAAAEPAPLFPPARPETTRPWWMPAEEEGGEPEPTLMRTGDHSPALPDLTLGRPRLEDELARPMAEEAPSGAVRRQAPWKDPDPWATGSFRRVGAANTEAATGSPLDTLSTNRRDRVSRPATSLPELEPLDSERRASGMPTQLVLGALLVVGVVAILVQFARTREGPVWASLAGRLTAEPPAADLVLPERPLSDPAPAAATLPPSEAEAQPPVVATAPAPVTPEPAPAVVEPPPAPASSLPSRTPQGADSDVETGMVKIVAPDRSRVWVDGTYVGRAPLAPQRIAVGQHEIKVSGRRRGVTVAPGRLATVDFTR